MAEEEQERAGGGCCSVRPRWLPQEEPSSGAWGEATSPERDGRKRSVSPGLNTCL